jgi:hypothetical protein
VFLAQLDTSVVNLALKRIGEDLGSSVTELQWAVDGYNLTYAAFLLTGGTLGDIFGCRRLFMIGVGPFCGVARLRHRPRQCSADLRPHADRPRRSVGDAHIVGWRHPPQSLGTTPQAMRPLPPPFSGLSV